MSISKNLVLQKLHLDDLDLSQIYLQICSEDQDHQACRVFVDIEMLFYLNSTAHKKWDCVVLWCVFAENGKWGKDLESKPHICSPIIFVCIQDDLLNQNIVSLIFHKLILVYQIPEMCFFDQL